MSNRFELPPDAQARQKMLAKHMASGAAARKVKKNGAQTKHLDDAGGAGESGSQGANSPSHRAT